MKRKKFTITEATKRLGISLRHCPRGANLKALQKLQKKTKTKPK